MANEHPPASYDIFAQSLAERNVTARRVVAVGPAEVAERLINTLARVDPG